MRGGSSEIKYFGGKLFAAFACGFGIFFIIFANLKPAKDDVLGDTLTILSTVAFIIMAVSLVIIALLSGGWMILLAFFGVAVAVALCVLKYGYNKI